MYRTYVKLHEEKTIYGLAIVNSKQVLSNVEWIVNGEGLLSALTR